jgi:hypothetical protein
LDINKDVLHQSLGKLPYICIKRKLVYSDTSGLERRFHIGVVSLYEGIAVRFEVEAHLIFRDAIEPPIRDADTCRVLNGFTSKSTAKEFKACKRRVVIDGILGTPRNQVSDRPSSLLEVILCPYALSLYGCFEVGDVFGAEINAVDGCER